MLNYLDPNNPAFVYYKGYPFGIDKSLAEEVYEGPHPECSDYNVLYVRVGDIWYDCHPIRNNIYPVRFDTNYTRKDGKFVTIYE